MQTTHTIAHAEAALNQRAARLLRLPGVLGVAVGFRQRRGRPENEPVVTVFVEPRLKRRSLGRVPRWHRIPRALHIRLGKRVLVVPVDLVPSRPGRVYAGSNDPVPPGEAVANQRSPGNVGTLGWVARVAGRTGGPVVCGACHVLLRLLGSRFDGAGDKAFIFSADDLEFITIPAPASEDSVSGYVIAGRRGGSLDAAVALLEDGTPTRDIPGLGQMGTWRCLTASDLGFPSGPDVSMRVGRGDLLAGKVTRYPAQMTFRYSDTPDGLVIEDLIETDLPARPGDSGGLLVDEDNRPVGMLLGAASGRSYFVHLRNITTEFELTDL